MVLLCPSELDSTLRILLQVPVWAQRVTYLKGSALIDEDLIRARYVCIHYYAGKWLLKIPGEGWVDLGSATLVLLKTSSNFGSSRFSWTHSKGNDKKRLIMNYNSRFSEKKRVLKIVRSEIHLSKVHSKWSFQGTIPDFLNKNIANFKILL